MNVLVSKPADKVLMYAIVAVSTIPFFKSGYGVGLLLICIVYLSKRIVYSLRRETVLILLIVFTLELYHASYFKNYDLWVSRQIMTFFFASIFTVYHLRLKFLPIYISIMYAITLVSFPLFIGLIISPDLIHSIDDSVPDMFRKSVEYYGEVKTSVNPIIYNFDYNFYKIRNNGPFWEPTVFASLLLIGQIFNFILYKKFFNKYGIIFTIGIITTFSTTVFIAYFVFIVSTIAISHKISFFLKISMLSITIFSSLALYINLPFLEEKIASEISGLDKNMETRGDSRMASATLDILEISQDNMFLLFGKGSDFDSRVAGSNKKVQRNCGVTALLVEWGIFFFIMYVALIYHSFHHLSRRYGHNTIFAIPLTCIILLISFSEVFLDLPLFHSFLFFGFVAKQCPKPIGQTSYNISVDYKQDLEKSILQKLAN